MTTAERIQSNLAPNPRTNAPAAERGGRDPNAVRLIAVTKTVDVAACQFLFDCGVTEFGENRLEVARDKISALPETTHWHMIGSVQRRKVRDIVACFDSIDAVDRLALAEAIQQRCEEQDRAIKALIEVNVSGESAKHGFSPEALPAALTEMRQLNRLDVQGLMTMAPFGAEEALLRSLFRTLRQLAMTLHCPNAPWA